MPHPLYGVRPAAQPGSVGLVAHRGARRDAGRTRRRTDCRSSPAAPACISRLSPRASPTSPTPARKPAPRPVRCCANSAPRPCTPASPPVDPATAAKLKPNDSQRIARAWEVWRGTGTGLAAWQAQLRHARRPGASPPSCSIPRGTTCAPPSPPASRPCWPRAPWTRSAPCSTQHLDPALPAMRAHGVPELSAYLRGEISLEEAGRRTELVTGQYTKRQATWFRHHPLAERTHTIHARLRRARRNFRKEI